MMVNVVGLLINSAFLLRVKTTSLTLEENSDFYQYVIFFLPFLHPRKSKRVGTVHLTFDYCVHQSYKAYSLHSNSDENFLIYIELSLEWLLKF